MRVCFGTALLPSPVVERVLELRIERREWIEDDKDGDEQVRHLTFFKEDGTEHGKWESWYANGQKQREWTYRNGWRHGVFDGWYSDGQKHYEHEYENGALKHGGMKWFEDGSLEYTSMGYFQLRV